MERNKNSYLWGVFAGVMLTLAFMGMSCAGPTGGGNNDAIQVVDQDGNPPPDGTPMGRVSFSVNWPVNSGGANQFVEALCDPTEWLHPRVKKSDGTAYFLPNDLIRPPDGYPTTTSVTLEVPVGIYTVAVPALKLINDGLTFYPHLLCFGKTVDNSVEVIEHVVTPVSVTLAASFGEFNAEPSVVYYGDQSSVETKLTNWPLEIRQAAADFAYSIDGGELTWMCDSPVESSTVDPLLRGCKAVDPLPSFGTSIRFSAVFDGSAYAGPGGIYPAEWEYGGSQIPVYSGSIPFQQAPPTGISVGIN
ncbi:MAG: hypothetical protein HYT22_02945 [Candidatus Niyogibacteria bacterium]|nr:hypothetical protein [Candidatus Niyogibacteria bacterium]